jgi:hypothetical protein
MDVRDVKLKSMDFIPLTQPTEALSSCKHSKEYLNFIKYGKFLHQGKNYQLLKK